MSGINKSVMLVRRRFRAKIILILIFYVMPVELFNAVGQTALSATDSLSAADVTITDSMDVAANSAAADSLGTAYGVSDRRGEYAFTLPQLIVPGVLIGVGVIGLESDWLKFQNTEMRNELQEHAPEKFGIDDIGQFVPALSVYALNMAGIKCAHNFKDCTIILGTAVALMAATVYPLKSVISFERPDGSSANSFPSGHTAMAFLGAEFLRREYRDVSPWIGVGGYAVAAATGFFRMYNNRHWFNDILAGAGIGILCTEAAYWLYPVVSKVMSGKCNRSITGVVSPVTDGRSIGLSAMITF